MYSPNLLLEPSRTKSGLTSCTARMIKSSVDSSLPLPIIRPSNRMPDFASARQHSPRPFSWLTYDGDKYVMMVTIFPILTPSRLAAVKKMDWVGLGCIPPSSMCRMCTKSSLASRSRNAHWTACSEVSSTAKSTRRPRREVSLLAKDEVLGGSSRVGRAKSRTMATEMKSGVSKSVMETFHNPIVSLALRRSTDLRGICLIHLGLISVPLYWPKVGKGPMEQSSDHLDGLSACVL